MDNFNSLGQHFNSNIPRLNHQVSLLNTNVNAVHFIH